MQIDFHHTVTYVTARLAGFQKSDAEIIAYAAQYVDDATSAGTVYFDNKALYHRISSAHKMVDPKNVVELANHQVWLPFHFLPGNGGQGAGSDPDGEFIEKIICRPDSPVAQDMVRACIEQKERSYGLYRLGVTLHVYADTWAHQGFAGVLHLVNEVEDARETSDSGIFEGGVGRWLRNVMDDLIPPLGHGRANVFPDMPFLSWQYENGHGGMIVRNNADDFCTAADKLCIVMQRYRRGDVNARVSGIEDRDMIRIRGLFTNTTLEKGEERHEVWLTAIADGVFSFGREELSYAPRGKNSWKAKALGISHDRRVHTYTDNFIESHWKLFHDAVQAHRFQIIHDILPKYGICAA